MSAAEDIAGKELPSAGHNLPADPVEALRLQLTDRNADLIARRDELLAGVDRAPEKIEDEDMSRKVTDFAKQVKTARKTGESRRKDDKEPHLEAGRTVDGFYKAEITDPLDKAVKTLESRLTVYQRTKMEAERRRREEEARKAAEEAKAREEALQTEEDLDSAIAAEEQAKEAERATQAKPAELGQVRGDYGVSSMRANWTFEITGPVDLEVLRPYFTQDAIDKAIRAAIKDGVRDPAIRGVRIFKDFKAVV